jgi:hypothetical protein
MRAFVVWLEPPLAVRFTRPGIRARFLPWLRRRTGLRLRSRLWSGPILRLWSRSVLRLWSRSVLRLWSRTILRLRRWARLWFGSCLRRGPILRLRRRARLRFGACLRRGPILWLWRSVRLWLRPWLRSGAIFPPLLRLRRWTVLRLRLRRRAILRLRLGRRTIQRLRRLASLVHRRPRPRWLLIRRATVRLRHGCGPAVNAARCGRLRIAMDSAGHRCGPGIHTARLHIAMNTTRLCIVMHAPIHCTALGGGLVRSSQGPGYSHGLRPAVIGLEVIRPFHARGLEMLLLHRCRRLVPFMHRHAF